jgi:phage terminase large subunit-like protein
MSLLEEMSNAFQLGKKSIVHFRQVFHPAKNECTPAKFHYEWDRVLRLEKKNFAIEAFRESGKSSYVCREFPLYCLVYPSEEYNYIVFVLANEGKAGKKLKDLADEYLNDPVLSANLVKVHENNQSAFEVSVKDDKDEVIRVRFEGYGKGSAIRGLINKTDRPKLVIIDDPQDLEDMKSETTLDNDWDWFLSDVWFLGQETRVFIIGNNLGAKCIIERISIKPESLGFTFVRQVAIDDGEVTWPAKYTIEQLEEEKAAFIEHGKLDVWYRERQCLAMAPDSQIFKEEDCRYYDGDPLAKRKGLNVYVLVDLAISKKKSADYTAIVVVGINSDNHWFILDIIYGRFNPDETIDNIFKMVSKWKPQKVGIEKVAFQQVIEFFLNKEMNQRNIFFMTFGLKAEGKKESRPTFAGAGRRRAGAGHVPRIRRRPDYR